MRDKLLILNNPEEVADKAIELWNGMAAAALREKDEFAVALSGGETPVPFYRRLAETESGFPWNKTHIFLVDERFVPPDHRDSNYRMIRETLIDRTAIPPAHVHPIPSGRGTLEAAADLYEEDIRNHFHLSGPAIPVFDWVLLGIGGDGHTASLFPGNPVLNEKKRLAAPVIMTDEGKHDRITLTLPVLNRAKSIIFLLTGEKKASILKQILTKENYSLPAALVKPDDGNLIFLADAAAGSEVHY